VLVRGEVGVTAVLLQGVVGVTAVRGASHGWSKRGRSEVVVLVRGEVWVTAVASARCGGGYGRARPK
jgi:hypothetical protein